jgi:hypothetical protein
LFNGSKIVAEGHIDYVKNHITFLDGNTWQRVENEIVNVCNGIARSYDSISISQGLR